MPEELNVRRSQGRRRLAGPASVVALAGAALAGLAALFLQSGDRLLAVEVALATWRAAPSGSPQRAHAQADALGRLADLVERDREAADLPRLAGMARELGRPDLAARALERAGQLERPACAQWLSQAARDFLAAGDPRRAADSLARAYDCSREPEEALAVGLRALDAYLAAGMGGEALRLADRLVGRFPSDARVLQRAEAIALGQDDRERARAFGERLMASGSVDAVSLGRQLDLDLAAGDLPGALLAAERLLARSPEDARLRLTAAKVAAWAGRARVALRHRLWLARHSPAGEDVEEALALARAVGDRAAVAELLTLRSRQGPLPAASLAELAEALESAGPPGSAVAALRDQVRRHPRDRSAWEELAAAQERRNDLSAALATRTAIARRFGGSLQGSLRLARLLWAVGRPGAALAELRPWTDTAGPGDVEYWELLADLAWDREADDVARRAYRALWDSRRIDAAGAERLLLSSREAGRREDVVRYGREGWARTRQPRLLLLAMDEAARAGWWGALARMAAEAASAGDAFAGFPTYWMLRARLEERAGRASGAVEAYRRALAADAGSAAARSGLIWLLASSGDRDGLARCLAAWAADAWGDPALWHAYAAGLEALGHRRAALAFYEREALADPGDAEAVARLAGALERTGDPVAAERLLAHLAEREGHAPLRVTLSSAGARTPALAAANGLGAGWRAPTSSRSVGAGSGRLRSAAVGAELRAEAIGPVLLELARATAKSPALGAEVEARASFTGFRSSDPSLRLPGEESEVLVRAAFPALGGQNEVAGGASLRADGNLPRAGLAHARDLGPFARARVEASLDEPADESAAMRVEAVRTRLGGALTLSEDAVYGRAGLDWKRWSTRTGLALGSGGAATAEVGWHTRADGAEVGVRLQGGYQRNQATGGPATGALAAFAPGAPEILPHQLAAMGLGAGVARWAVGPTRLLADAWVGWLWPPARPAFRAQLGVSVEAFRHTDLSLTGFAANDRWTRGGDYGVSVAFTHGFPR